MTCRDCIHYGLCRLNDNKMLGGFVDASMCGLFKNIADFVKVVRCKECKYCVEEFRGYYVCTLPIKQHDVNLWHFCSYGERKDTQCIKYLKQQL